MCVVNVTSTMMTGEVTVTPVSHTSKRLAFILLLMVWRENQTVDAKNLVLAQAASSVLVPLGSLGDCLLWWLTFKANMVQEYIFRNNPVDVLSHELSGHI